MQVKKIKMVLVDDFIKGMVESTKELGEPFISESIWTEAVLDLFSKRW